MALPSDPDYIPAATDPRILACPAYQDMLAMNTDPYAVHSLSPSAIEFIEQAVFGPAD